MADMQKNFVQLIALISSQYDFLSNALWKKLVLHSMLLRAIVISSIHRSHGILFYGHLGLGDQLLQSGLVRYCQQQLPPSTKIFVVAKWLHRFEMRRLYADLADKIYFYWIQTDEDLSYFSLKRSQLRYYNFFKIWLLHRFGLHFIGLGKHQLPSNITKKWLHQIKNPSTPLVQHYSAEKKYDFKRNLPFFHVLYQNAGFPPTIAHDYFFLPLTSWQKKCETKLFQQVQNYLKQQNLTNPSQKLTKNVKNYILIHQDKSRNYVINPKTLLSLRQKDKTLNCPIFYIGLKENPIISANFFDYRLLLVNATAFHGFDSSFMLLLDLMSQTRKKQQKYYLHDYIRTDKNAITRFNIHALRKNWTIAK